MTRSRKLLLTASSFALLALAGALGGGVLGPTTASATPSCMYEICNTDNEHCVNSDLNANCNDRFGPFGICDSYKCN